MFTYRVWAHYKQVNSFDPNMKATEVIQLTLQSPDVDDAIAAYVKWVRRNRKELFKNITSDGVFYEILS